MLLEGFSMALGAEVCHVFFPLLIAWTCFKERIRHAPQTRIRYVCSHTKRFLRFKNYRVSPAKIVPFIASKVGLSFAARR